MANDNCEEDSDFSAVDDSDTDMNCVMPDDKGQVQQSCSSSESGNDFNLLELGNYTKNMINVASKGVDHPEYFLECLRKNENA